MLGSNHLEGGGCTGYLLAVVGPKALELLIFRPLSQVRASRTICELPSPFFVF